jgi:hypothetical protein
MFSFFAKKWPLKCPWIKEEHNGYIKGQELEINRQTCEYMLDQKYKVNLFSKSAISSPSSFSYSKNVFAKSDREIYIWKKRKADAYTEKCFKINIKVKVFRRIWKNKKLSLEQRLERLLSITLNIQDCWLGFTLSERC